MAHNNKHVHRDLKQGHLGRLLIATVGLPGRGKSLLARRMCRYLKYTRNNCKVFDISDYRRKHYDHYDSHEMFKEDNRPAWEVRQLSFQEALNDAVDWLLDDHECADNEIDLNSIHVAILDGPNVCRRQRQIIFDRARAVGVQMLFIECFCEDSLLLEMHFKSILAHSVDYRQMPMEMALEDLRAKMDHYEEQYETPAIGRMAELPCSMVKLLDDGYGGLLAHGVNGGECAILGYISTPKPLQQTLYFSRHGESEFNILGRIGGDSGLSPRGCKYAEMLANHLKALNLQNLQIWTSTLKRTKATVANINVPKLHFHALDEIHSGECENYSYEELLEHYPKELALRDGDKLRYRYPQGESYLDVMSRLLPLLQQLEMENNVLVIGHQAVLRCVLAYFLGTPADDIPYMRVPLHTLIKLTLRGYDYTMETVKMPVECVDTNRCKPTNCEITRSKDEVLKTIPQHFDSLVQI